MAEVEKEIKKEEKKIIKFFSNKSNIWMSVSVVLAVLLVVALAFGSSFGNISKEKAASLVSSYASAQGATISIVNVTAKGNLYQVLISYQGQNIPFYVSKDGKYLGQMTEVKGLALSASSSASQSDTPQNVPKSDKPTVILWVFTYCPYGTQTEKGLIPVYNLLKDKAIIDIKYIGAMHGQFEETESLRQLCIQKNYGQDKFMSYIMKLDTNASVGNCGGADSCVLPIINNIYSSLGIDKTKIDSCMINDAPALYAAQEKEASSLGISGSPTLVINDVQVQSGRSPSALLSTICSAFNTSPSECTQTLDSASPSAGFGATASESASAAQCG